MRHNEVDDVAWAIMNDSPLPDPESQSTRLKSLFYHAIGGPGKIEHCGNTTLFGFWQLHRDEILSDWSRVNPGTRPTCWWKWDAPRWADGEGYEAKLAEPRRRIGGVGDPWHPSYRRGIPFGWMTADEFEYYNGRAFDIHGQPIGTEYKDGDCTTAVPDPATPPPIFESQAAYLDRHGLFLPGERKRLTAANFEHETLDIK